MIIEDYVSYEVAKLLNEKGFDEPCRSAYIWNTEEYELCTLFSKPLHFNREGGLEDYEDDSVPRISAPTHQMAMKWLREVHNIDIDINAHCGMLDTRCYIAYVSTYKPYKLTNTDKKCGLTKDDVKHRLVQTKRNTRIPSKSELIPAHEAFGTYKDAVEAALKYCLEYLI